MSSAPSRIRQLKTKNGFSDKICCVSSASK
jgi:hypothetical protein